MSYKKIKELLPKKCSIRINETPLDKEFLERLHGTRFDPATNYRVYLWDDERNVPLANVFINEAFHCCAKAYLWDFDAEESIDEEKDFEVLIGVCEEIAENGGYTHIGFIHQNGDETVKAGKKCGFKASLIYKNKRSGNKLSEMYKLI